ncbi:MAG TPA: flippase [Pseudobdellovibrionaceae bacterium]|nr:flippase [Pseudobdellovibrionaceae bacterium]
MFRLSSLKSYFLINLAGQIIPLIVGLFTIPKLITYLGIERFGALSIVWVLIGYFSLFDFGLSRTLTYLASKLFHQKKWSDLNKTFWTVLGLVSGFSLLGSLMILLFKELALYQYIKASPSLLLEINNSLWPIAISIPIVSAVTALRGLLEADEKFYLVNFLQILLGVYTFVSPLLLPPDQLNLANIVYLILAGRFFFLILHGIYIFTTYDFIRRIEIFKTKSKYLEILKYGGWLTVSNLVNPFMVYLDRFFLSLIIPTSQVAYYTTPYEMTSRLLIIPASISRAIFPRLSGPLSAEQSQHLAKKSVLATLGVMGLICAVIAGGSYYILKIWLGGDFPEKSQSVLIILTLGVLINSLAYTPYTLLQSKGRADITSKLHLAELPFYLVLFYFLTLHFGIQGAAAAWSLRFAADTILLFYFTKRI